MKYLAGFMAAVGVAFAAMPATAADWVLLKKRWMAVQHISIGLRFVAQANTPGFGCL